MKKGCILLLTIVLLVYGYQAYQVMDIYRNDVLKIKTSGKLSDITEKVTPIPLDIPDSGAVRNMKQVRRDGNNLFILSDSRLLHFDMKGKFINQIAKDLCGQNGKWIAEYVLDTINHKALVVDNERYLSTFDYNGNLITSSRIDKPWQKITALAFHNGYLWATAETLVKNNDLPGSYLIEHKLYQLDMNMNEIYSQTLRKASSGTRKIFNSLCVDELLVDEQGIYAYSMISDADLLLEDTLNIALQKKIPLLYKDAQYGMGCIYPVRKGKRHYLSTCSNCLVDHGFTFCYDDVKQTAYILADGFKDDFFKTGHVTDLQSMDIYNDFYCFLKSGNDISKKFPERADNNDLPVLFILQLHV